MWFSFPLLIFHSELTFASDLISEAAQELTCESGSRPSKNTQSDLIRVNSCQEVTTVQDGSRHLKRIKKEVSGAACVHIINIFALEIKYLLDSILVLFFADFIHENC